GDMPEYTLIASRGPAHLPEFEYAVFSALSRQELGRGKGQSKQAAQLEAASRALELIQARSNPDK
ncbi:MAG: ribonuclease III, partial [Clostridia bacterium]|nr:ribonuclease III [Clostridia bacterium]